MQRAERESLIPLDPVAPPAPPATTPSGLGVGGVRVGFGGGSGMLIAVGILAHSASGLKVARSAEPAASSAESAVRKVSIGARGELDAERKDGLAHTDVGREVVPGCRTERRKIDRRPLPAVERQRPRSDASSSGPDLWRLVRLRCVGICGQGRGQAATNWPWH